MDSIDHIGQLTPDSKNARRHNPRNVGLIVDALHEVGAARSIVIDENGRILAGNATVEAAAEAGIEHVQVVDVDGETIVAVRRRGLTEAQKVRLALYDNRSAELADWDPEILADLQGDDGLLNNLFTDFELEDLLGDLMMSEPFGYTATDRDGQGVSTTWQMARNAAGGQRVHVTVGQLETWLDCEIADKLIDHLYTCYKRDGTPVFETFMAIVINGLVTVENCDS